MKVALYLEDNEDGIPVMTEEVEGYDPDRKSMSYSVFVLLKMALFILNSEHRPQLVDLIATLYRGLRADVIAESTLTGNVEGNKTCH